MGVSIDAGQILIAVLVASVSWNVRSTLRELRALRLDHDHLARWASRRHHYAAREAKD